MGWQSTAERVCTELLSKEETKEEDREEETKQEETKQEDRGESCQDSWFLVSMNGLNPSSIPDKYPESLQVRNKRFRTPVLCYTVITGSLHLNCTVQYTCTFLFFTLVLWFTGTSVL